MLNDDERRRVASRFAQAMREVGVLLIAFAPLDYSMEAAINPLVLAGFLIAGLGLFCGAVYWEIRRGL